MRLIAQFCIAVAALQGGLVGGAETSDEPKICVEIESLARTVMEGRLAGVPMSTQMELLTKGASKDKADLGRILVTKAYREHRWQTARRKQVAIEEFGSWAASACYAQLK